MLRFLLGTSVLKRLGHLEVRTAVEPLATTGQLGRPSICDLEVGDSARNAEEWDRLVGSLNASGTAPAEARADHCHRLVTQRVVGKRPRGSSAHS